MVILVALASAEDFEYNTGGVMGTMPTTGGSSSGWGEWFVTTVENDTGHDLVLTKFGFPCCGPTTGDYGWIVWEDVGSIIYPPTQASGADFYGSFTPADTGYTFPPDTYTYVDVSAEDIVISDGAFFCFGYDVTDIGGQIDYNGVETWAWYEGAWDPDQGWVEPPSWRFTPTTTPRLTG
ncbi:hypothetical protein GF402_07365 [Candidatus Fermentibacteria bacterium]|nr:hypothetical protein [Candidatus Fermentibacteria bacterium]